MIIKCKMCGGDLEFQPGATYGTCEYCGSTSTIPQADDEGKLNRYNRANHFRRQCEFDKAVTAYEKLLEQDDTDAEAHWGAVISRYGIEYVEDPATKKRIPTCHRVQVASILADADYLAAVENAPDAASRDLYKQQAAEIAEIQKGILAISANEKPYDVFICYKETDEQGQRTRDSQWAQDVYYGLTEQGYKVFFSRITLEDKLGQQYEPYIFAALNSARVMVVIGSRPEYFNAVWVKNEWSRYLALMAKDRKRLLIPCYRGMDPYDLPEELSTLQSQDMSKIGFMQDLLRGIKKVLDADKQPEQPKVVQQVVQTNAAAGVAPGISSLMERTYLFMEDGDFDSAAEYLNRVLDIDPKFAPAYAAKVCVAFRIRKEAGLADATFQYEDNPDWQKALRFADAQQKAVYEGYAAKVKERVTRQIRDYAYDCAMEMAVLPGADRGKLDAELAAYKASCTRSNGNRANGSRRQNRQLNENAFKQAVRTNEPGDVSEQGFKTAAAMFDAIKDSEATECAKQCRTLAEQARQKLIYNHAVAAHGNSRYSPTGLEQAAKAFMSIPEYKDAKAQAQKCVDEAEAIRDSRYSNAVTAMKEAGDSSSKWEKAKNELADSELTNYRDVAQLRTQAAKRFDECLAVEKDARQHEEERLRRQAEAAAAKKKRITIFSCATVAVIIATVLFVTQYVIPHKKYVQAELLLQAGNYQDARAMFVSVETFSDAKTRILETHYEEAQASLLAEKWDDAILSFSLAGEYSDAEQKVIESNYQKAQSLYTAGYYSDAYAIYRTIPAYKDVSTIIQNDTRILAVRQAIKDSYAQKGNIVTFGHYEQDGDQTNGAEAIEWIVLDTNGAHAMLISRYVLGTANNNEAVTDSIYRYEFSGVRSWLNGSFYTSAFNELEQKAIVETLVDNSSSQSGKYRNKYGHYTISYDSGANTKDKLFALSYQEAEKYFSDNDIELDCQATQSIISSVGDDICEGNTSWWLRSTGDEKHHIAFVNKYGFISNSYAYPGTKGVRPVLWLNLDYSFDLY